MTDSLTGAFKNYYGVSLAELLAHKLSAVHPTFDSQGFIEYVKERVEPLELKGRVRLIRDGLRIYLPEDYLTALDILSSIFGDELTASEGMYSTGFWITPIAAYVQEYGLEHFEPSMKALYEITKRFSSEEAIRPYIARHTDRVLPILEIWSHDPNEHVRRLVSEGTRPRLPWAMNLQLFIADPSPVLALLENLKDDPSLYVRRSVANNLNEIAKDNPDHAIATLTRWYEGASPDRLWLINHGLRYLIKAGNPQALAVLGYQAEHNVTANKFALSAAHINIGDSITMDAELSNTGSQTLDIVIDYAVHYVKANGKTNPKVFKWTTRHLEAGQVVTLTKKHDFRDVSIRTHRTGIHRIDLLVNGKMLASAEVQLT